MAQGAPEAFFSYCRDDSEFAIRLAEDLRAAGANVWLDQLDIEPGMPWDRAVENAVTNCASMLVILSPTSVNSDNVRDEISFALSKRKRVIPVLYRECDVPFRLARIQHIDFRTDYARGLKLLLKTLGVEQRTEPIPPAAPAMPKAIQPDASHANGWKQATQETPLEEAHKQSTEQGGASPSANESSHKRKSPSARPQVTARPESDPPFEVDAIAIEDDTHMILSADPTFAMAHGSLKQALTKAGNVKPLDLGSVVTKPGSPLRFLAVIHDLSTEPTWTESSVQRALSNVFVEAEKRKLKAIGVRPLGTQYGSLREERFVELFKIVLAGANLHSVEKVWLVLPDGFSSGAPGGRDQVS